MHSCKRSKSLPCKEEGGIFGRGSKRALNTTEVSPWLLSQFCLSESKTWDPLSIQVPALQHGADSLVGGGNH